MESQVTELLSSDAAKGLFFAIVSAGFVFYIVKMLQNYIISIIALKTITGSFRISQNDMMRFPTAIGSRDGRMLAVDRKRIEIEFPDSIMSIPTSVFVNMPWEILKPTDMEAPNNCKLADGCEKLIEASPQFDAPADSPKKNKVDTDSSIDVSKS